MLVHGERLTGTLRNGRGRSACEGGTRRSEQLAHVLLRRWAARWGMRGWCRDAPAAGRQPSQRSAPIDHTSDGRPRVYHKVPRETAFLGVGWSSGSRAPFRSAVTAGGRTVITGPQDIGGDQRAVPR